MKGVALQHGMEATFMPKPYRDHAGSGAHLHVSVLDAQGRNIFEAEDPAGSEQLRHAIGGLAATMNDAIAICAPTANSYRRFQPEAYVPLNPSWSVNNRGVAFRVPHGPPASRRVEHRIAGADANPYLLSAIVLAGMHLGLTRKLDPGPGAGRQRVPRHHADDSAVVARSARRVRAQRVRARIPGRALCEPVRADAPRRDAGFQLLRAGHRLRLVPDHELKPCRSRTSIRTTPPRRIPRRTARRSTGDVEADVCVVGGGIAGCATALFLAERGYKVVLLEGNRIAFGASGRSGGQAIVGYACSQDKLVAQVGKADAKKMFDISVDALDLMKDLIAKHRIDCDLHWGHLHTALKPRQEADLRAYQDELVNDYGYTSARAGSTVRNSAQVLDTDRYIGGLRDDRSGHLHPLNYTLGLAAAAAAAGVTIHEQSMVVGIEHGATVKLRTAGGAVGPRASTSRCAATPSSTRRSRRSCATASCRSARTSSPPNGSGRRASSR